MVGTFLLMSACTAAPAAAGGIWDMIKNSSSNGKIETKQYTIEVAGTNIRGYVYDVPEMKSICWNVFTDRTQQLDCKTYNEMGIEDK